MATCLFHVLLSFHNFIPSNLCTALFCLFITSREHLQCLYTATRQIRHIFVTGWGKPMCVPLLQISLQLCPTSSPLLLTCHYLLLPSFLVCFPQLFAKKLHCFQWHCKCQPKRLNTAECHLILSERTDSVLRVHLPAFNVEGKGVLQSDPGVFQCLGFAE